MIIHPSPCPLQPPKYHIWSMKKTYVKSRMKCMILFTIDDLDDGNGRKTPKYTKIHKEKQIKKFPVWLPSHSPVCKNGGRLFSGVRKNRKQAGPTRAGTGILVLWGKEIQGWARNRQIKQVMWFLYVWTFKIFNKGGLGYGLKYKSNEDREDLES